MNEDQQDLIEIHSMTKKFKFKNTTKNSKIVNLKIVGIRCYN